MSSISCNLPQDFCISFPVLQPRSRALLQERLEHTKYIIISEHTRARCSHNNYVFNHCKIRLDSQTFLTAPNKA